MNKFQGALGFVKAMKALVILIVIIFVLLVATGLYISITGNDFLPPPLLPLK